MMRRQTGRPILLCLLLPGLLACSDTPTEPTVQDVAGVYRADGQTGTFRFQHQGGTADLLAEGARIHLTLFRAGATSGELRMLGVDDAPADYDLEGTWRLEGESILLDHPTDTFLRDMRLRYVDGRLTGATGSVSIDGRRIEITLVRE